MSELKQYLGDAVYAEMACGMIKLSTEDGMSVTNVIYLEADVLANFQSYLKRVGMAPGGK